MLTNILFLDVLCTAEVKKQNGTVRSLIYISDFAFISRGHAVLLITSLFSMAGIPPFSGFFTKLFVLLNALQLQFYLLVIIAISASLISTYYYLRILKIIFFENRLNISSPNRNNNMKMSGYNKIITFTLLTTPI